jgi:rubrerythrin
VVHFDGRNSIRITHPQLAEEFDIERNAPLTPEMVKFGSIKKIHWRCSACSNVWISTPNNRTANGRGCPACAGQAIHSDGRNSMRSTHPHLVEEFDMERNAPLTPDTVMAGTSRRLHWNCSECSHEWVAVGSSRSMGKGCPVCSNQAVHTDGRNSMRSTHHHLAEEFDLERNAPLTPDTVVAGTNKKLYWICSECSNNWITAGNKRVAELTGCPACSGNALHSDGRNSMRSTHPHVATEFDLERNAPLTPDTVIAGTNRKLHWICSGCSHKWAANGNNRVGRNETGCPACANKVVHNDGRNSMRSTHPHLTAEFDIERNAPLTPDTVVAGTNQKLYWICSECSHKWGARSNSRTRERGSGCPVCAKSGFDPSLSGQYYVIRVLNESDDTIMYKGGKSNDYQRRFKEHMRKFRDHPRSKDWALKLEEVIHHEIGADTHELETMLLKEDIRASNIEGLSDELFTSNPLDHARAMGWV